MIWFNVTNVIQIDGEVSADGVAGDDSGSGGGSGGSIWMHCYRMKGAKLKLDVLCLVSFLLVGRLLKPWCFPYFQLSD